MAGIGGRAAYDGRGEGLYENGNTLKQRFAQRLPFEKDGVQEEIPEGPGWD